MALTLPTPEEFLLFWGDEAEEVDDERISLLISLSADLLYLATGITEDPKDARLAQLVKYAICDMSIYIFLTRENINEEYSPFQSERVGSYSYSKTFDRLSRKVNLLGPAFNETTGVPLFDRVVMELMDYLTYGSGTVVAGQRVFREYYVPLVYEALGGYRYTRDFEHDLPLHHGYGGNADADYGLYRDDPHYGQR